MAARSVRLDKWIASSLPTGRKEARLFLKRGDIWVDGAPCLDGARRLAPDVSAVVCAGSSLPYREYHYIMMNKPAGVLSATEDRAAKTALDLLPEGYRNAGLFPAGRLDKDTTGFLLLTNDGDLGHAVTAPARHVDKRYYLETDRPMDAADVEAIAAGLTLADGTALLPAALSIGEPASSGEIVIREGKYHQIKRMLAARGKTVVALRRLSIGAVTLDSGLTAGEWRPLTDEEEAYFLSLK